MMIIDPVALGDTSFSRASTGTYFDAAGVLQTAAANALRVTYDPSDLSKAPYALAEAAATNLLLYSDQFDNAAWAKVSGATITADAATAPNGSVTADLISGTGASYISQNCTVVSGAPITASFYVKSATAIGVSYFFGSSTNYGAGSLIFATGDATFAALSGTPTALSIVIVSLPNGWLRVALRITPASGATGFLQINGADNYLWGAQIEAGAIATSYIATTSAVATRAADIIGTTAGLVYSNVTETEPLYPAGSPYALGATVRDAAHNAFQSLAATNSAALTDATKWLPLGATNCRAMFDQYNITQTTNAEEIIVVASPLAISQGIYFGNVDASEIRISVVDLTEGLVYSEVQSLVVPNSGSSFFNWAFRRIQRKSYAVSVQLPVYANALVTIAIKKPGGTAKCGICALGSLVDVGLSQYGLGTETKDYSSTTFNFDGTSNTVVRGFSKRLTVDVVLDNSQIDTVIEALTNLRQKPVAWVGAPFGAACAFGRYSSFKNIIESFPQSKMALQIEGTV